MLHQYFALTVAKIFNFASKVKAIKKKNFLQQLLIAVYDNLRPLTRTTSTVVITVNRNPSAPTVQDAFVTIEELIPVFTNIVNVTASDPDGVSFLFACLLDVCIFALPLFFCLCVYV